MWEDVFGGGKCFGVWESMGSRFVEVWVGVWKGC